MRCTNLRFTYFLIITDEVADAGVRRTRMMKMRRVIRISLSTTKTRLSCRITCLQFDIITNLKFVCP